MAHQPSVLLLGESLFMDSIAERLSEREMSHIIRISSKTQNGRELASSFNPDLIVYELDSQNSNSILKIIREQSNTMHLAIDLVCNQIILLNCQRKPADSLQELCDLVSQEITKEKNRKEVLREN